MKTILVITLALAITIGLVGNAYAHKSQVIGDYKIGVGWKNEPPIAGIENSIEVVVTKATEFDKMQAKDSESMKHDEEKHDEMKHEEGHDEMKHDEKEHDEMKHDEEKHDEMKHSEKEMSKPGEGVSGLSLEVIVTLGEEKTELSLVESSVPGVYHAKYTPMITGHPLVDLSGEIGHTEVGATFHPEKVESKSMLAPLKQLQSGTAPDKIQCKDGMELISKASTGEPACVKHETAQRLVELGWALF
jgi:hypothetical protein